MINTNGGRRRLCRGYLHGGMYFQKNDGDTECATAPRPEKKRKGLLSSWCGSSCSCPRSSTPASEQCDPEAMDSAHETTVDGAGNLASNVTHKDDCPAWVVLNDHSNTVHRVVLKQDVYACCGWSFQGRSNVMQRAQVDISVTRLCKVCVRAEEV